MLPVPYREDAFHARWATGILSQTLSVGTLEFLWLEKVEVIFMEIGLEVVINLAVVGYIQWLMATVFCKKLNLRVKNGKNTEWRWASLVKARNWDRSSFRGSLGRKGAPRFGHSIPKAFLGGQMALVHWKAARKEYIFSIPVIFSLEQGDTCSAEPWKESTPVKCLAVNIVYFSLSSSIPAGQNGSYRCFWAFHTFFYHLIIF